MFWINFLHLYQPANSDPRIIKEAAEKSYKRIARVLEKNSHIKFTVNISGCLIMRFDELGLYDLINRIKALVAKGQIELVGTAAYHPILPLVPETEARRQIQKNEKILKKYLGVDKKLTRPKGFFMPEMAYSAEAAKIIKDQGYKWIILDEIAFNGRLNQADTAKIYEDASSGLKVIFRNREISQSYVPETLLDMIKRKSNDAQSANALVTATDGELYGLRHKDPTASFERLLKQGGLKTLSISEYINGQKCAGKIKLFPSSWDSSEEEIKENKPYELWFDANNKIQVKLWELAGLANETIEKYPNDKNYNWARWHIVRGLASCTFWWASAKDFKLFSSISWSPDEIERGLNELIRSVRSLDNSESRAAKLKAEAVCLEIKKLIWEKHWSEYWKKEI